MLNSEPDYRLDRGLLRGLAMAPVFYNASLLAMRFRKVGDADGNRHYSVGRATVTRDHRAIGGRFNIGSALMVCRLPAYDGGRESGAAAMLGA